MVTQMLPPCNRLIIGRLLKLCFEIQGYQSVNKMTATNLAIVFAPMVFQYSTGDLKEMIRLSEVENKVFEFLVMNAATVMLPVRKQLGGVRCGTALFTSANRFNDGMRSAGLRLAQSLMHQRKRGVERAQQSANRQLHLNISGTSQTDLEPKQGEVTFREAEATEAQATPPKSDGSEVAEEERALGDGETTPTPGEPSPKPESDPIEGASVAVLGAEEPNAVRDVSPESNAPPLVVELRADAGKRRRSSSKGNRWKIETEEERKARKKAKREAKRLARNGSKSTNDSHNKKELDAAEKMGGVSFDLDLSAAVLANDATSPRKSGRKSARSSRSKINEGDISFDLDLSSAVLANDASSPRKSGRKSARSSRSKINEDDLPRRPHTSRAGRSTSKSPRKHHRVGRDQAPSDAREKGSKKTSKKSSSKSPRRSQKVGHDESSKKRSRSKSLGKELTLSPRHHTTAGVVVEKADSCEMSQASVEPVVLAKPVAVEVVEVHQTISASGEPPIIRSPVQLLPPKEVATEAPEVAAQAATEAAIETVTEPVAEPAVTEEDAFAVAERKARKDALLRHRAADTQAAVVPVDGGVEREDSVPGLEPAMELAPPASAKEAPVPADSLIDSLLSSLQESTGALDTLLSSKAPARPRERAVTEVPQPVATAPQPAAEPAAVVPQPSARASLLEEGKPSAPQSPTRDALATTPSPSGRRRRRRGTATSGEVLDNLLATTLSSSCATRTRSSSRVRPSLAPSASPAVGRCRSSTPNFDFFEAGTLEDVSSEPESLPELEPIEEMQAPSEPAKETGEQMEGPAGDEEDVDDYFSQLLQGQELEEPADFLVEEEEEEEDTYPKYAEIEYTDGSRYEGMVTEDHEWTGRGKCFFADGDFYEGEVSNNSCSGVGTLAYNNGDKYTGQFVDGERHGNGVYVSNNGDLYEGEFVHNCRSGYGTYRVVVGDVYVGYFKDGVPHGQGEYSFATGDRYKGEFVEDVFEGEGTYTSAQGSIYVGAFHQGARVRRPLIALLSPHNYTSLSDASTLTCLTAHSMAGESSLCPTVTRTRAHSQRASSTAKEVCDSLGMRYAALS